MKFLLKAVLCCMLLNFLTGCAANKQVVVLDQTKKANIKTITLLAVTEPKAISVNNAGGGAALFGVVGGVIQGNINADHAKTFAAALNDRKVMLGQRFSDGLIEEFKQSPYQLTYSTDRKVLPRWNADKKEFDFSDVTVDSDAFLFVRFAHNGYFSGAFEGYHPFTVMEADLFDAKTKEVLYHQKFVVGLSIKFDNQRNFPAAEGYEFSSFDEIMQKIDHAVEGLDAEQKTIASALKVELQ